MKQWYVNAPNRKNVRIENAEFKHRSLMSNEKIALQFPNIFLPIEQPETLIEPAPITSEKDKLLVEPAPSPEGDILVEKKPKSTRKRKLSNKDEETINDIIDE